jgi:hypothetical protein
MLADEPLPVSVAVQPGPAGRFLFFLFKMAESRVYISPHSLLVVQALCGWVMHR